MNREKHRHSASLWQIWSHTVDGYSRTCRAHYFRYLSLCYTLPSDSARHRSQDIFPPISQIVLKNSIKISLIIKECPKEILIKLAIFQKISKSIWNTVTTDKRQTLVQTLVTIGTVYIGGDCRSGVMFNLDHLRCSKLGVPSPVLSNKIQHWYLLLLC